MTALGKAAAGFARCERELANALTTDSAVMRGHLPDHRRVATDTAVASHAAVMAQAAGTARMITSPTLPGPYP